jgi:hypothetical protein
MVSFSSPVYGEENAEKPPLFSDGYRPGAVRELREVYGGTVTVSS